MKKNNKKIVDENAELSRKLEKAVNLGSSVLFKKNKAEADYNSMIESLNEKHANEIQNKKATNIQLRNLLSKKEKDLVSEQTIAWESQAEMEGLRREHLEAVTKLHLNYLTSLLN